MEAHTALWLRIWVGYMSFRGDRRYLISCGQMCGRMLVKCEAWCSSEAPSCANGGHLPFVAVQAPRSEADSRVLAPDCLSASRGAVRPQGRRSLKATIREYWLSDMIYRIKHRHVVGNCRISARPRWRRTTIMAPKCLMRMRPRC